MANLILSVDPDVMGNPKLELLDKLILSYVTTWEQRNNSCFAKDGFLAGLFGVEESEVHFSLLKLEAFGFIEQIHGTYGRLIRSKKEEKTPAPGTEKDVFEL